MSSGLVFYTLSYSRIARFVLAFRFVAPPIFHRLSTGIPAMSMFPYRYKAEDITHVKSACYTDRSPHDSSLPNSAGMQPGPIFQHPRRNALTNCQQRPLYRTPGVPVLKRASPRISIGARVQASSLINVLSDVSERKADTRRRLTSYSPYAKLSAYFGVRNDRGSPLHLWRQTRNN